MPLLGCPRHCERALWAREAISPFLNLGHALARVWRFLREVSGDRAYEVYAERWGPDALSPRDFYLDSLKRRYDRVSRCC